MATVQNQPPTIQRKTQHRDTMNNEISSTSSEDSPAADVANYDSFYRNVQRYTETTAASDTETFDIPKKKATNKLQFRNHHKSMGNINDSTEKTQSRVQNSISNVDLTFHSNVKKFETLQVPIVGYEVMEERARFTIYKLKVEDDERDQSWLVFRRYTDFVRLFSRIKAELPSLMLPLPGKRWFRDNFDPAFLEERVRGLQLFVDAILKKLPKHPVVREFFCLDEPPQVLSYQPEVQAVYGALEDSISSLKIQLKQKDSTIVQLQNRVRILEAQARTCGNCSSKLGLGSS